MLTEERYNIILELLREKRSVTVAEIKDRLGISESTIRRDLNALAQEGKLTKYLVVRLRRIMFPTEWSCPFHRNCRSMSGKKGSSPVTQQR